MGKIFHCTFFPFFFRVPHFSFSPVSMPCHAGYKDCISKCAGTVQVPGSTIFYVGIRVVSLRCKSYRMSLFQKVAFVNNNNNNNNNNNFI